MHFTCLWTKVLLLSLLNFKFQKELNVFHWFWHQIPQDMLSSIFYLEYLSFFVFQSSAMHLFTSKYMFVCGYKSVVYKYNKKNKQVFQGKKI